MKLRVFNILKKTKVEGGYTLLHMGSRVFKALQRMSGCSYLAHSGGKLIEVKEIIADIAAQKDIEGVTFLGGEPFEQPEALGIIAENVRKAGLSVLCFTGALIEDLRLNPINRKLLDNIDLLIDGEFVIDKVDYSRPWCGSSNQRYHFLTSRYNDEIFAKYKNKVEVNISKSGVIFMNGMGNFDEILQKIDLVKLKK